MEADSASDPPSTRAATGAREGTTSGSLFRRPLKPLKPQQGKTQETPPIRYVVKEDGDGPYIACLEAPEAKVRVERGLSVTISAARKYPAGTIFLDGAAQGEPFLDLDKQIYNLDHHEGCVRPFTLAACEQALVLVYRGMDLRDRPWTIWANEPDLDTILAIWVLLNSMHLIDKESPIRDAVVPLVRLEGAIDAHGLEFKDLAGLSAVRMESSFRKLEVLRGKELELKRDNRWDDADLLQYLTEQLQAVDEMVYPEGFFEAFRGIEELAKVELAGNRIAVVCRSDCGIYELETDLKRLYGKRLGIIIQQKSETAYTLRQVDPFLAVSLEAAYRKLNVLDPAVEAGNRNNRWGGSGDIGGSPRTTGTALSPIDIAEILRLAYRRPGVIERLKSVGLAILVSAVAMLAGWSGALWEAFDPRLAGRWMTLHPLRFTTISLVAAGVLLAVLAGRRQRRLYGLQLPEGRRWLWMSPVVIGGAVAGGVWAPPMSNAADPTAGVSIFAHWLLVLLLPLLGELTFRGLAHGVLVRDFSIQHSTGRWFVSLPVIVSTVLYAGWTLACWPFFGNPASLLWPGWAGLTVPLGAMVAALGLGMARERSGSLIAALVLHLSGVGVALLLVSFFA